MSGITSSLEDYLETIMLHSLNLQKNLIMQERYKTITLLPEGCDMAQKIYERHETLILFFEKIIGVPRNIAEQDACRIEHIISTELLKKYKTIDKD